MAVIPIALLALLAVQSDPLTKPTKALDPKDAQSIVEHAVYNTRSQSSYETAYTARWEGPSGAIDYEGRSVWVSPDILYIHYKGSGKDEKRIVRAGEEHIWIYNHLVGDWVTAQQSGDDGAGRGIQNPDDVLRGIGKHQGTAKLLQPGVVQVGFTGADVAAMMRGQIPQGELNPGGSSATLVLTIDANGRIQAFRCEATLTNKAGDVSRYTSQVKVTYDGTHELVFADDKSRPIPLHPDIKEQIKELLKRKK